MALLGTGYGGGSNPPVGGAMAFLLCLSRTARLCARRSLISARFSRFEVLLGLGLLLFG
jgi:hypothetical protein